MLRNPCWGLRGILFLAGFGARHGAERDGFPQPCGTGLCHPHDGDPGAVALNHYHRGDFHWAGGGYPADPVFLRYGGVVGGSISGIVAGAMFGLATSGINGVSGALAFAGLMAGNLFPLGTGGDSTCVYCGQWGRFPSGGRRTGRTYRLYEVMAATVIFAVWPAARAAPLPLFSASRRSWRTATGSGGR